MAKRISPLGTEPVPVQAPDSGPESATPSRSLSGVIADLNLKVRASIEGGRIVVLKIEVPKTQEQVERKRRDLKRYLGAALDPGEMHPDEHAELLRDVDTVVPNDIVGSRLIEVAQLSDIPLPEVQSLYSYDAPSIVAGQQCGGSAGVKFNLAHALGVIPPEESLEDPAVLKRLADLQQTPTTKWLWMMKKITEDLVRTTDTHWGGPYAKVRTLDGRSFGLKIASIGEPSSFFFPDDEDFAKQSNNVSVMRTGEVRSYPNVEQAKTYYECSGRVKSEICLPIYVSGVLAGFIDIESWDLAALGPRCGPLRDGVDPADVPRVDWAARERFLQSAVVCMDLGHTQAFVRASQAHFMLPFSPEYLQQLWQPSTPASS